MAESPPTWVRKYACQTDLSGGQCIANGEVLTHHTAKRHLYINAPPTDVERASVRYTTAGDLRAAGFAVIHTCGRKGEGNGHVSVVWPADQPLDAPDPAWPAHVRKAFAACFTEGEG